MRIETKYNVGETVFAILTDRTMEKLPCPDCHDTKEWIASTANGTKVAVTCPRCSQYNELRDLPTLSRIKITHRVETLTIGTIRTDSAVNGKTEYMCVETGIGSGTLHAESKLHATIEAADAAAEIMVDELQAIVDDQPEQIAADRYSELPLSVGVARNFHDVLYGARVKVSFLESSIAEALQEGNTEWRDELEWAADRSHANHIYLDLALHGLVEACEKSEDPGVTAALKRFNADLAEHVKNMGVR